MARRGRNPNLFIRLRIKDSIENRTREGGTQAPFIMGTKGVHAIRRWNNNPPFFNSFTVDENTGVIGSTFQLDVSASDFDNDVLSYSWSISGPGSPSLSLSNANKRATFTAAARGDYTITVSVSDGIETISQAKTVSVLNRAPTQNTFTINKTSGYVNDSFILTMVSNTDPDGDPVTITWSGISSDQISVTNPSSVSSVATVTPTSAGTFTITATVSDGAGGTYSNSETINVAANTIPTVSIVSSPTTGYIDTSYDITTAITNLDPGKTLTYSWTVNGGAIPAPSDATGVTLVPGARGTHTVVVTIDDGYNTNTASTTYEAVNRAPVINSYSITPITGNLDTIFTHSVSATDPEGDNITYTWNIVGASGANITGSGTQTTFKAPEIGTYYIDVTASDDYSPSLSTNQRLDIEVENGPPVVSSFTVNGGTTATGTVSDTYIFEVTASDPDNHSLTYTWGSNAGSSVFSLSNGDTKAIYNPGLYRGSHAVSVRVRDGYGGDVTETINILIQNQAPIAQISRNPSQPLETGQAISLYGTGSSDPDGDSITLYTWEIISSSSSGYTLNPTTGDTTTFTPTDAGTYVVGLTVSDGMADSAEESIELTISSPGGGGSSGGSISYPSASIDFETFGAPYPQKFIGTGSLQSAGTPFGGAGGVSYSWSLTAPVGSTAFLVDPYLGETDIMYATEGNTPVAGSYTVSLTVSADVDGDSTDEVGSTSYTYTITSFGP